MDAIQVELPQAKRVRMEENPPTSCRSSPVPMLSLKRVGSKSETTLATSGSTPGASTAGWQGLTMCDSCGHTVPMDALEAHRKSCKHGPVASLSLVTGASGTSSEFMKALDNIPLGMDNELLAGIDNMPFSTSPQGKLAQEGAAPHFAFFWDDKWPMPSPGAHSSVSGGNRSRRNSPVRRPMPHGPVAPLSLPGTPRMGPATPMASMPMMSPPVAYGPTFWPQTRREAKPKPRAVRRPIRRSTSPISGAGAMLSPDQHVKIEAYLSGLAASNECPLCDKIVQQRATTAKSGRGDKARSERSRRWDHLRKTHHLTTCDGCGLRLPRDSLKAHKLECTHERQEGLDGLTPDALSSMANMPTPEQAVATTGLNIEQHTGIHDYLAEHDEDGACPLCFKHVVQRKTKGGGGKARSERARRWDHLRKSHGLATCEKCGTRICKDKTKAHAAACLGVRSSINISLLRASPVASPQPAAAPPLAEAMPRPMVAAPPVTPPRRVALALPPKMSPIVETVSSQAAAAASTQAAVAAFVTSPSPMACPLCWLVVDPSTPSPGKRARESTQEHRAQHIAEHHGIHVGAVHGARCGSSH